MEKEVEKLNYQINDLKARNNKLESLVIKQYRIKKQNTRLIKKTILKMIFICLMSSLTIISLLTFNLVLIIIMCFGWIYVSYDISHKLSEWFYRN